LKILLITIHLPPPVNYSQYNLIENLLLKIENSKINCEDIIILGDFNIDYMNDNNGNLKLNARHLNNIFLNYNMQQIVKHKSVVKLISQFQSWNN
jgi:hypothetical protein